MSRSTTFGLAGLARCTLNPARAALTRSSGWAYPVSAMQRGGRQRGLVVDSARDLVAVHPGRPMSQSTTSG